MVKQNPHTDLCVQLQRWPLTSWQLRQTLRAASRKPRKPEGHLNGEPDLLSKCHHISTPVSNSASNSVASFSVLLTFRPAPAKDDCLDGDSLGGFPQRVDDWALISRSAETRVGMSTGFTWRDVEVSFSSNLFLLWFVISTRFTFSVSEAHEESTYHLWSSRACSSRR